MIKKIVAPVLLIVSMVSCHRKTQVTSKDSVEKLSVDSAGIKTKALIKQFKPSLAGFWVNKDYIDEIEKTKSTQQAYNKVGPITDMLIDTSGIKSDSLLVDYNSAFHEVFRLIIKFHSGVSKNTITAYDPVDYIERKFYEIKSDKLGKFLTIYSYNKKKELVDSTHFFKTAYDAGSDPDKLIINKMLISGNYVTVDSLKNSSKVSFTNEGTVTGLNGFKTYELLTDFMTPPNNLDQIGFDTDKNEKWYAFKISADTLNIYETKDAPDSVDLVLSNLKYKLVKLK